MLIFCVEVRFGEHLRVAFGGNVKYGKTVHSEHHEWSNIGETCVPGTFGVFRDDFCQKKNSQLFWSKNFFGLKKIFSLNFAKCRPFVHDF